jgi:hypothetical protein
MRIVCSASVLLIATIACTDSGPGQSSQSAAPASAASRPIKVATSSAREGRTWLELLMPDGQRRSVSLPRDGTVAASTEPTEVKVIGQANDAAVVLVDRYSSLPSGMSYCQAGEEQFLRIVQVVNGAAGALSTTKLASCRENLELSERGVEWDPGSRTVRVHWLIGPDGKPETRTLQIDADGRVKPAF